MGILDVPKTACSSSSSAKPASRRAGEPKAGLAALGGKILSPTRVFRLRSPLSLLAGFLLLDDPSSSAEVCGGASSGGGEETLAGNGRRDAASLDLDFRRIVGLGICSLSSSPPSGEDSTSSSSYIPAMLGARESLGICGDAFGSTRGRRALACGLTSLEGETTPGEMPNDWRKNVRCLTRLAVWLNLSDGRRVLWVWVTHRSFRISHYFPRLVLFSLQLCGERNLGCTQSEILDV